MSLSSSQLEAFAEVAKTGSFSQAAKNLHLTQSALSQRVINLEESLSTSLLIRDRSGLRLTPTGEELLRYCQMREGLEQEVLGRISKKGKGLSGRVRIAGFSSVMRSLVMPSLSDLVLANPLVTVELFNREVRDLPSMLARNEVDFIVTMTELQRGELEGHLLGHEENVLIESKENPTVSDAYFDHDSDDLTTVSFFRLQKAKERPSSLRRAYLDEIYAILDAVELGWGRAVVPRHLVASNKRLRVVSGLKPLKTPILLQYYRQPFYSKLHEAVVKALGEGVERSLD